MYGKLYLIPNFLSLQNDGDFIANFVKKEVKHLKNFIVEHEKQARALIKVLALETPQNDLNFWLLNEHTPLNEISNLLEALKNKDAGIITDAGLPCVADPGWQIVSLAQQKNIQVIALPGASSIMLALMASGFSGQQFTFHGYLPIEKPKRAKQLKDIEFMAARGYTQIFMEAPYRNNQFLTDMLHVFGLNTKLCIACNISDTEGFTQTKTVEQWKKNLPELHKKPVIYLVG